MSLKNQKKKKMNRSKDYKKLIMVTSDNNNKFYEMIWEGGSTFTVNYGRVESTSTTISYPYSQWNKKYNEKVKKGYKDVTEFVAVTVEKNQDGTTGYAKISDNTVHEFMELMRKYRDNLVDATYSVKSEAVSQKQVDEAQSIIDNLNRLNGSTMTSQVKESINVYLLQLYGIIPRKMKNVKDHLIPKIKLDEILEQEQDNLDAMASQVAENKSKKKGKKEDKNITILEELGLTMAPCTSNKEIEYLTKQVEKQDGWNKVKVKSIFRVDKDGENKVFEDWLKSQKNKDTKILIHGTRCSSVIPILDIGLKIRPKGNFQFSGKVYGDGNYFSETVSKSLNYTGWQADKILLVYEVHTGNPFVYDGWFKGNSFNLTYPELQKRGYDSTFVKAGNGLLNSEIIAYKEEQNRIKYIIWLQ